MDGILRMWQDEDSKIFTCIYKVRAVEEMLKQTEEDADKEILEMKTGYEVDLKREAESNVKLRSAKFSE